MAKELYKAALDMTSTRGARARTYTTLPPPLTAPWTSLLNALVMDAVSAARRSKIDGTSQTHSEHDRALAIFLLAPRIFLYRRRGGDKENRKLAARLYGCANNLSMREAEVSAYVADVAPTVPPFPGGTRDRAAVAEGLVREALPGKAIKALSSDNFPMLDLTVEKVRALDALYPQGIAVGAAAPNFTAATAAKKPNPAEHDEYVRLLSKCRNRTAPGHDGFTKELLMPMLKSNTAAALAVTGFVYDIQCGDIPDSTRDFFTHIRGVALDRGVIDKKQKIRAYGMFSTFVKLAWKGLFRSLPLADILPPWQYGGSRKFGAQRCAQRLQREMDDGMDAVVGDAINGYGTVHREAMIGAVENEPLLHPLVQMMRMFYTDRPFVLTFLAPPSAPSAKNHVVRASTGAMIGDVAAANLYMLAVAHALKNAPASLTDHISAYVDDYTVTANPDDSDDDSSITARTDEADRWLKPAGQVVFESKVKVLSRTRKQVAVGGKTHNSTYSTTHLGAPVLYYDLVQLPHLTDTKFYQKNVKGFVTHIDELKKQTAWLIFNHVMASSRYLLQATLPRVATAICDDLREFASVITAKILNVNMLQRLDQVRLQLVMTPIADGGLGVVDAPTLGPTWHKSVPYDSKIVRKKMEQAKAAETAATLFDFNTPVTTDDKLMWQLRKLRNAAAACFSRCTYLTTFPIHRRLVIDDFAFSSQLCLHLLVIAIPEPFCLATGKPPDFTDKMTHPNIHPHVCAKCSHPATTHRHEQIQRTIVAASAEHDILITPVTSKMTHGKAKPDIQIFEPDKIHCADLTVAMPLGNAHNSSRPDINVMHLRAGDKHNHYNEWRQLTGMELVPLVFSALGFASNDVRQWAKTLTATTGFATRMCSWTSAAIVNENGKIYSNYISMTRGKLAIATSATTGQPFSATARSNVATTITPSQQPVSAQADDSGGDSDEDELGGRGKMVSSENCKSDSDVTALRVFPGNNNDTA